MAMDIQGWPHVGRGITKTVYCDVDGTLLIWRGPKPGSDTGQGFDVNWPLVSALRVWLQADPANRVVIWIMGGIPHSREAQEACGMNWSQVSCAAKPDLIIDDAKHEKLFARIRAILPHEFTALVNAVKVAWQQ